jgi:hypothetical protein
LQSFRFSLGRATSLPWLWLLSWGSEPIETNSVSPEQVGSECVALDENTRGEVQGRDFFGASPVRFMGRLGEDLFRGVAERQMEWDGFSDRRTGETDLLPDFDQCFGAEQSCNLRGFAQESGKDILGGDVAVAQTDGRISGEKESSRCRWDVPATPAQAVEMTRGDGSE